MHFKQKRKRNEKQHLKKHFYSIKCWKPNPQGLCKICLIHLRRSKKATNELEQLRGA